MRVFFTRAIRRRFRSDIRGVSSVEFALFAPFLLAILVGLVETAGLVSANRRLYTASAATADLIAQAHVLQRADLDDVFEAAELVMAPADPEDSTIVVSSVRARGNGELTLEWSEAARTARRETLESSPIPDGVLEPGATLILVEISLSYESGFSHLLPQGITLRDWFIARPRRSIAVELE